MKRQKFRFNTMELSAAIRRELANHPLRAKRAMDAVGGFLNGEAKDLTPVDEGFLTADVSNRTVEYKKSYAAVIYIPSNGSSAQYAVPMHENEYILGPKSQDKQKKVGKVVGRKFITRAIDGNLKNIRAIIVSEAKI